ncbi:DUF1622 domain-containing protein [Actinomadura nitritigenes]|uniref:DUF1622 domain-containing protein n=1 Tax=Actinomadura nitritigenes TaxID=134602 RepID=UPI003D8F8690
MYETNAEPSELASGGRHESESGDAGALPRPAADPAVNPDEIIENVGLAVDLAGVALIVCGAVAATAAFGYRVSRRRGAYQGLYRLYRQDLGRAILLGLEVLVAGDIIRTVAVSPTLGSVAVLAAIVGVRTFLSFSLEVELDGRWPWQQAGTRTDRGPG